MTTTATTKKRTTKRNSTKPSAEEKLCAELVALLEKGVNPWRKEWKPCSGSGFFNLASGHEYRGCNPSILAMYMAARAYELPLFLTFKQGQDLGLKMVKGSTACYILKPKPVSFLKTDDDGEVIKDENGLAEFVKFTKYAPQPVFNVSCFTAPDDATQEKLNSLILKRTNPGEKRPAIVRHGRAAEVIRNWEVPITHGGDRACYRQTLDVINLPHAKDFTSEAAYLATAAHECIHSTGHKKRLNRDLSGQFGSMKYAREELVAELGAFLVCNRLSIDSNTENHAAYLQCWAKTLKESPDVLFKVLSDATRAANLIAPDVIEAA